jgi:hypothetical protein
MSRYYVDVTEVSEEFLEFMGYCKVTDDDEFELRITKDKEYILPKQGPRYSYVDDPNDALMFRARAKVAAPSAATSRPRKPLKTKSKKRRA